MVMVIVKRAVFILGGILCQGKKLVKGLFKIDRRKGLTHFTFRVEYRPICSHCLRCRVPVVRSLLPPWKVGSLLF